MNVILNRLEKKNNRYARGMIEVDGVVIKDHDIFRLINDSESFESLSDKFKDLGGCYSLCWEENNSYWIVTDRLNSIPIYFNSSIIADSREGSKNINKGDIFFQLSGVMPHDMTVNDLKSSYPYEIIRLSHGSVERVRYGDFFSPSNKRWNKEYFDWECEYSSVNKIISNRLRKICLDRQIVVPLSGGYDSRLVLDLLHKAGVKKVLCYTYGEKNEKEVAISKAVAEHYGYNWEFIEYSSDSWKQLKNEKSFIDFIDKYSSMSAVVHFQDFKAVSYLKEKLSDEGDVIFIPGHAMDFLAGNHIPSICFKNDGMVLIDELAKYIVNRHFSLRRKSQNELKIILEYVKDLIHKEYPNVKYEISANEAISFYMKFNFEERQTKFILSSLRIYDYFGFDWFLPLWEPEYVHFYESCDIRLLKNRYVSIEWDLRNIKPKFKTDHALFIYDKKQIKPARSTSFLMIRNAVQKSIIYNIVLFFILLKKMFIENTFGWFSMYSTKDKLIACLKGYKEIYSFEANKGGKS